MTPEDMDAVNKAYLDVEEAFRRMCKLVLNIQKTRYVPWGCIEFVRLVNVAIATMAHRGRTGAERRRDSFLPPPPPSPEARYWKEWMDG